MTKTLQIFCSLKRITSTVTTITRVIIRLTTTRITLKKQQAIKEIRMLKMILKNWRKNWHVSKWIYMKEKNRFLNLINFNKKHKKNNKH